MKNHPLSTQKTNNKLTSIVKINFNLPPIEI